MPINGKTALYGIIGNPVGHSLSPAMHNAAFQLLGEDRVYLPFSAEDAGLAVQGLRALSIKGVSVTIPHKEAVMSHLDRVDPVAVKIGAVNTITSESVNGEVILCGYNTDWIGANRAIENEMNLSGKKVVVLGAGGSARAIGFGLLEAGAEILLCSRTESRGRKLAEDLGCEWCSLDDTDLQQGDALVNATSVGMAPQQDMMPVIPQVLRRFKVVMDIVYAPLKTRLLAEAEKAGCTTITGIEMLLYQGAAQFELWTGAEAPVEIMREVLMEGRS